MKYFPATAFNVFERPPFRQGFDGSAPRDHAQLLPVLAPLTLHVAHPPRLPHVNAEAGHPTHLDPQPETATEIARG